MFFLEGGFDSPDFNCGTFDWGCSAKEGITSIMIGAITGMGDFSADVIVNAFKAGVTDDEWGVAFGEWGKWAAAMAIFVAIVMLYQVGMGMLMQNRARIMQAVLGGALSIPLAALSVMLMARLVNAIDGTSDKVLSSIQGGQLGKALVAQLGLNADTSEFEPGSFIHDQVTATLSDLAVAALFPAIIMTGLMLLAGMFLLMAMEFRDISLLLLAGLAPMALMMIGQGKLAAWGEKWFSITTGLVLMKPIVVGIFSMIIALNTGVAGRTAAELLVSVLVLFLAAFAPFWVVKLVDFTGGEVGAAMASRPRMSNVTNNRMVANISSKIMSVFKKK